MQKRASAVINRVLSVHRTYKKLTAFFADLLLCVLSVIVSFSLRLGEWTIFASYIYATALIAVSIWAPVFISMGTYQTIFRFAGAGTLRIIALSTLIYSVPFAVICMVYTLPSVPRTIGILQPILFFLFLCISRILVRYILVDLLRQKSFSGEIRRVLIYGAGSSGQQLAVSLRTEPGFQIIGFVDDDKRLNSQSLDGIRVYYSGRLPDLVQLHSVTDIILAMPRNTKAKNKQIVESLEEFAVHVRTLPAMSELVDGRITADVLREINVEDLLGRDPVPPNELLLGKTIVSKTVLVTGAGGSIGSELCKQIMLLRPNQLILVEMAEYSLYRIEQDLIELKRNNPAAAEVEIKVELANVSDQQVVARMFKRWQPDTVFHAAAYKHVPLVEYNPLGGMRNNIFGTYFCAQEAEAAGVKHFILISTDKAVRPTNVMGATKRVCELILQALASGKTATRFTMVRFGNVLGSSGSVVPRFEQQIRMGGPVTLTDKNVTRYFMTIPEAAQLVIQAGAMAQGGEVYVLDMGKSVRIVDLARTMIRLSGLTVRDETNEDGDIEIVEVGLRPGEKLYEELLIGDNPESTIHRRIFRAREHFIPKPELERVLETLAGKLRQGEAEQSLQILHDLVPEFQGHEASSEIAS